MQLKLIRINKLTGKILLKSGLHIGAGNMEMHIGGIDSPVIKHPYTNEPYIPGSSLKGKVRSLLELKYGLVPFAKGSVVSTATLQKVKDNKVKNNKELEESCKAILKIFGSSGAEADITGEIGPTRVSFSDCYLDKSWKKVALERRYAFSEEKSETAIDRISGTAQRGSLRQIERVPESAEFSFHLTYKVLQDGDEKLFNEYLLQGLKLLEMDALGGSGSRGYGRIRFINLERDDSSIQETFDSLKIF